MWTMPRTTSVPVVLLLWSVVLVCECRAELEIRKPENVSEMEFARRMWKEQEDSLKESLESFFRTLFPTLVRLGSEAEISAECQAAYFKMFVAVRQLKSWALRMVDSSGKLPNGLMSGTAVSLGHFDQCLDIEAGDAFRGQFCNLELWLRDLPRPSAKAEDVIPDGDSALSFFYDNGYWLKLFPMRLGICIPSACSADDLQRMATQASKRVHISANVTSCQVKEPIQFSREQLVVLCVFGVLLTFVVVGTLVDVLFQHSAKHSTTPSSTKNGRLARLIVSFSVVRNTRLLFAGAERPQGPLDALNGIRVVSCFWIVLGHIYFLTDLSSYIRFSSLTKLQVLFRDFLFTVVENFTLPVDTFFFVTGLLLVYNQRKKCSKKQTISFWDTVRMVTHRYWRMTPPFALTTALFILVPTIGSGPMWWEVLSTPSENCRLHWWSNLLYFSNYMSYTKMCMLHSWFLSLNMQYFIIGIPLALMLFRNPGATSVVILALTLACSAATSTVAYLNNLPPTMLMMTSDWSKAKQNLNMVYYQPFTHFGPFAVGLCLGYILSVKKAPRFSTATLVAGWLTSLSMMGASLFAPYPFRKGDAFSPVFSAVYAGCHRTLWTLGVAWLTLLCSSNQAGLVGSALSSSTLTPLSKLSYLTYLLHPIPIYVHVASTKEAFQLDHYYMCTLYLGILTTSIILAYLAYVTVELPFASLEAILTSSPAETSKPALPLSLCKEERKRNGSAASRGPALSAPTQAKLNESSRL